MSRSSAEQLLETISGRLSPRSQETLDKIARPIELDGYTQEEVAAELGLERREVARALDELRSEAKALVDGAVLPPLSSEEEEALRTSLQRVGQLYPVLVDEEGRVLDGHHRARLLEEAGIEPKTIVVDTHGDPELRHEIELAANTARRTLSPAARQEAIAAELVHDPAQSDRSIAAALGVNNHAVGRVRRQLEERGELLRLQHRRGSDGVRQPARKNNGPTRTPALPYNRLTITLDAGDVLVIDYRGTLDEATSNAIEEAARALYGLVVKADVGTRLIQLGPYANVSGP